ncbi:hypothetical protein FRB93_011944 [Tulasnella sp. JGI-2019a]|nr:hypothetical protein FRB93_011944 [Tulasnella sp. JGI-2019a]
MLSLFPHSISLSLLGIALLAAATPLVHLPRAAPALRWGACPSYNATALTTSPFPVVCANFTVPFDWNTTTAKDNPGSFVLTVGKIAATTNQSLGTTFVNPLHSSWLLRSWVCTTRLEVPLILSHGTREVSGSLLHSTALMTPQLLQGPSHSPPGMPT